MVYATERVRRGFTEGNVLYRTLERFPGQVTWRTLQPGREVALAGVDGPADRPPASRPSPCPASCRSTWRADAAGADAARDNIGLKIREPRTGRRLAYFPAAGRLTAEVRKALADADCVFFDGTFWSSDELPALGLGTKRAEDMAHLPVGGAERQPGRAPRAVRAAPDLHPHQQHQPPAARRLAGAQAARSSGLGDRLGRHGGRACDHGDRDAAAHPRGVRRVGPPRGRAALPRPPPLPRADARGKAHAACSCSSGC